MSSYGTLPRGSRMSMMQTPQYQTLTRGSVRHMSTQSGMLDLLMNKAESIIDKCDLDKKSIRGSIRGFCKITKFEDYQDLKDATELLQEIIDRPNIPEEQRTPMGTLLIRAANLMGMDRSALLKDASEQKTSLINSYPGVDPLTVMDFATENVLFRTLTWHLNTLINKYKAATEPSDKKSRPSTARFSVLGSAFMNPTEGGRRKSRKTSYKRRQSSSRRRRTSSRSRRH